MDLISRDKAQDAVFSKEDIMSYMDGVEDGDINRTIRSAIRLIERVPSAFKGMTYGEVMKAVLGIKDEQIEEAKYLICIYPKGNHHDPFMAVKREVWNSPYKELSVILNTVGGE